MSYAVLALTICEKPNGLSSADSRQLRIIQRKLSVAVLAISTVHSIQSALERALEQPVVHVSSLGAYTLEDSNNSATPKDAFTPLFSIEDVIYSAIRFAQSKVAPPASSPVEFRIEGESTAAPVCIFSLLAQLAAPVRPAVHRDESLPASTSAGVQPSTVQHPSLYGHAEPDKQPQEARTPERSQQTAFAASSVRPVATPSLSPQQARENDFSKKKKRSLHDINQASAAHTLEQQRDRSAPAPERLLAQLEAVDQAAQQQASAHPCVGNAVVHHAQASAAPTGPETHTTCRSLPPLLPPLLPADEVDREQTQTPDYPQGNGAATTTATQSKLKSCNLCAQLKACEEFPVRFRGDSYKTDAYCRMCTRLITPARQRGMKMADMRKAFQDGNFEDVIKSTPRLPQYMTKGEKEQAGLHAAYTNGKEAGDKGADTNDTTDIRPASHCVPRHTHTPRHIPPKYHRDPKEALTVPGFKDCNLCWKTLSIDLFSPTNSWSDKRVPYCKTCMPYVRRGVKLKIGVAVLRSAYLEGNMHEMLGMSCDAGHESAGDKGMESDGDAPVVTPDDDACMGHNDDNGSEVGTVSAGRFGQLDSSGAPKPELQKPSASGNAGTNEVLQQPPTGNPGLSGPGETRDGSWEDAHATFERFPQDHTPEFGAHTPEESALAGSAKPKMEQPAVEHQIAGTANADAVQTDVKMESAPEPDTVS